MKNLPILALLAAALAVPGTLSAMIKPQTSDDVFRQALAGHLQLRPAPRSVKLVKVNGKKARTWDEARAQCRRQGADLPTPEQYVMAVMSKSVDVRIDLVDMGEATSIHPMWVRTDDETANAGMFAGTAVVMTLSESTPEELQGFDVSPAGVASVKAGLAEVESLLKKGHYQDEGEKHQLTAARDSLKKLIAAFSDGYPAYCAPR